MKCEYCGKDFGSETALLQHTKDKHPDEKLPEVQSKTEAAARKKGGKRSIRRRKSHRVLYLSLVTVAILSGVGIYGLYNVYAHPSGPYGPFPFGCGSGGAEHVHPYLRIVISGQNVTIPADIGIIGSCLEPLHTHDTSGILHVEASSLSTRTTLNDFFQIWKATFGTVSINGVQEPIVFNSTDILGFKSDATHSVTLLVDGKPSTVWGALTIDQLDYCDASTTGPPCSPTAVGTPYWNGQQYPYGTLHTIVIEYGPSPS